jgi:4-hydroxythreonine-4-phosphate dehydrogenase
MFPTPPEERVPQVRPGPDAPIVVTMGDPLGIGPEIVVRACAEERSRDVVIVGDVQVLRRAARWVGVDRPIAVVDTPADVRLVPSGALAVCPPPGLPADLVSLPVGRVDDVAAQAAVACIGQAVRWAMAGDAAAVVTAPIHKESLAAAGVAFPGHTEMLQAWAHRETGGRSDPPAVRMMLANDELKVVLVTIHLALREAIEQVTQSAVLETLRISHAAARRWGLERPCIAVAGLNPHAGEAGLFGREEIEHIAPAIQAAQAEGIDARGPYAPDTVFMRARSAPGHAGEFDLVVAMTHDHGLIPVKYLGLDQGVNVTLGLPFVRTSPDHGTAFDLVGTGRADASSMAAALAWARRLLPGAQDG